MSGHAGETGDLSQALLRLISKNFEVIYKTGFCKGEISVTMRCYTVRRSVPSAMSSDPVREAGPSNWLQGGYFIEELFRGSTSLKVSPASSDTFLWHVRRWRWIPPLIWSYGQAFAESSVSLQLFCIRTVGYVEAARRHTSRMTKDTYSSDQRGAMRRSSCVTLLDADADEKKKKKT